MTQIGSAVRSVLRLGWPPRNALSERSVVVTSGRESRMRLACFRLAAAALSALCFALFTCSANSQNRFAAARLKPFDGGKADALGLIVQQARERAIEILQAQNSCSAWFREADPDAPAVFESLEFVLDDGPKYVLAFKSDTGETLLKHPYSGATQENGGNNTIV